VETLGVVIEAGATGSRDSLDFLAAARMSRSLPPREGEKEIPAMASKLSFKLALLFSQQVDDSVGN
jgi:hypothetical protein